MATGTSSGLLEEQHAQSLFKHAILDKYVLPFASMTGSKAIGKRVVWFDGFAGRGRHEDGTPAGAELVLQTSLRAPRAIIESVFVEKSRAHHSVLSAVVDEYVAQGVRSVAHRGEAVDHLPGVISQANGVPLFLFLDPCGAGLPFDDLAAVLTGPRHERWPSTEVMLNFSADMTRRAAGVLKRGLLDHDALPRMDLVCGGTWWRQTALEACARNGDKTFEPAAFAVVNEYARRLGQLTGMYAVTVPVRRRAHNQPVYHLVFLTRSSHGIWVFADSVAKARHEWMKALGPEEGDDEGTLFSFGTTVDLHIEGEQAHAQGDITKNLLAILDGRETLKLVQDPWAVFGNQYGVATEVTVRRAVRALEKSGRLRVVESKSKVRDMTIGRPMLAGTPR